MRSTARSRLESQLSRSENRRTLLVALGAAGVTLAVSLGLLAVPAVDACAGDTRGVVACLRDLVEQRFDLEQRRAGRSGPQPAGQEAAEPPIASADLAGAPEPNAVAVPSKPPPQPEPASPAASAPAGEPQPDMPPIRADGQAASPASPMASATLSAGIAVPPPVLPQPEGSAATPARPGAAVASLSIPALAEGSADAPALGATAEATVTVPAPALLASGEARAPASPSAAAADIVVPPAPPVSAQGTAATPALVAGAEAGVTVPPPPPVAVAGTADTAAEATEALAASALAYAQPGMVAAEPAAPTIDAVELDRDRHFVSGAGPDGAQMRLYSGDRLLGESPVQQGRWLVEGDNLVSEGDEPLRVEAIEPVTGKIVGVASARVAIAAPAADAIMPPRSAPEPLPSPPVAAPSDVLASAPPAPDRVPPPPGTEAPPAPRSLPPITPVVPRLESPSVTILKPPAVIAHFTLPAPPRQPEPPGVTLIRLLPAGAGRYQCGKAIIRRGDTLWAIARRYYGHGIHYRTIFNANREAIRRPSRIYPGQVFDLPLVTDE